MDSSGLEQSYENTTTITNGQLLLTLRTTTKMFEHRKHSRGIGSRASSDYRTRCEQTDLGRRQVLGDFARVRFAAVRMRFAHDVRR